MKSLLQCNNTSTNTQVDLTGILQMRLFFYLPKLNHQTSTATLKRLITQQWICPAQPFTRTVLPDHFSIWRNLISLCTLAVYGEKADSVKAQYLDVCWSNTLTVRFICSTKIIILQYAVYKLLLLQLHSCKH